MPLISFQPLVLHSHDCPDVYALCPSYLSSLCIAFPCTVRMFMPCDPHNFPASCIAFPCIVWMFMPCAPHNFPASCIAFPCTGRMFFSLCPSYLSSLLYCILMHCPDVYALHPSPPLLGAAINTTVGDGDI